MTANTQLISLRINGEATEVAIPAHTTLLEMLRYHLDLIGSKQGCDKGDCGACTVQVNGRAVLACLTLASQAQGKAVTTVEGLVSGPSCHPLYDAMDRWTAAQCGFCTPGILMSAEALIRQKGRAINHREAAEGLAGNLCRCTGYTKILDAVVEASQVIFPAHEEESP